MAFFQPFRGVVVASSMLLLGCQSFRGDHGTGFYFVGRSGSNLVTLGEGDDAARTAEPALESSLPPSKHVTQDDSVSAAFTTAPTEPVGITFERDQSGLFHRQSDGRAGFLALRRVAEWLAGHSELSVVVVGYSSPEAENPLRNKVLQIERSEAVRAELAAFGIQLSRVQIRAGGNDATSTPEFARRVEIYFVPTNSD